MKKLFLGCLGLVALGVVGLLLLGLFAASRQPTQTVTQAPTTTGAAASGAPAPTKPDTKPAAKAEEKAATPARVGEHVESGAIALSVASVARVDALGQIMRAKPGRTIVTADVTLENTTRDRAPYNPAYFKVRDADGYEYNASLAGPDNYLKSGELPQGDRVRGVVAFDVPAEAKGLVLSYQPVVVFGGYQTIRVQLD